MKVEKAVRKSIVIIGFVLLILLASSSVVSAGKWNVGFDGFNINIYEVLYDFKHPWLFTSGTNNSDVYFNETKLNETIDARAGNNSGDIQGVLTPDEYLQGGCTSGTCSIIITQSKLNDTIDDRVGNISGVSRVELTSKMIGNNTLLQDDYDSKINNNFSLVPKHDQALNTTNNVSFSGQTLTGDLNLRYDGLNRIVLNSTNNQNEEIIFYQSGDVFTDWRIKLLGATLYFDYSLNDTNDWRTAYYLSTTQGFFSNFKIKSTAGLNGSTVCDFSGNCLGDPVSVNFSEVNQHIENNITNLNSTIKTDITNQVLLLQSQLSENKTLIDASIFSNISVVQEMILGNQTLQNESLKEWTGDNFVNITGEPFINGSFNYYDGITRFYSDSSLVVYDTAGEAHLVDADLERFDEVRANTFTVPLEMSTINNLTGLYLNVSAGDEKISLVISNGTTSISERFDYNWKTLKLYNGTSSSPVNNYIYVAFSGNELDWFVSFSEPTLPHALVSIIKIGSPAEIPYSAYLQEEGSRGSLKKTQQRMRYTGLLYISGFDFSANATFFNISSGRFISDIDPNTISGNISSDENLFTSFLNGSYKTFSSLADLIEHSEYSDGSSFGSNKLVNVLFGVIPFDSSGRLYAVIQSKPPTEYTSVTLAFADSENTLNILPSDSVLALNFLPIARMIFNTNSYEAQLLPNGLYAEDYRGGIAGGTSSGGGLSEADPLSIHYDGTVSLTDDWDAGNYNITSEGFVGRFYGFWNNSVLYYLKSAVDNFIRSNSTENKEYTDLKVEGNISVVNDRIASVNSTSERALDYTINNTFLKSYTETDPLWSSNESRVDVLETYVSNGTYYYASNPEGYITEYKNRTDAEIQALIESYGYGSGTSNLTLADVESDGFIKSYKNLTDGDIAEFGYIKSYKNLSESDVQTYVNADTCSPGNYSRYNGSGFDCYPDISGGSFVESDPLWSSNFTAYNMSWSNNTQLSDSDIAGFGYIKSYTETDPRWSNNYTETYNNDRWDEAYNYTQNSTFYLNSNPNNYIANQSTPEFVGGVFTNNLFIKKSGVASMIINSTDHNDANLILYRAGDIYIDWRFNNDAGSLDIDRSEDDANTWETKMTFTSSSIIIREDIVAEQDINLTASSVVEHGSFVRFVNASGVFWRSS